MRPGIFWILGPWGGRLALVARPRGGDWLEDEAKGWQEAGIDVIVSLLEEEEAVQLALVDEARAAQARGIRFISFPIPDRGVPASVPAAVSLIAAIASDLKAGKNVAVHCRQSVGRAGLIAAAVLTISGLNSESAMETVSAARGETIPETTDQRLWIQRLPSEGLVAARSVLV